MYPIYFFLTALTASIIQIVLFHTPIIDTLLLWTLTSCVGLQGLFAFTGHFFIADKVAHDIGWPTGNPFQTEIAFANLSLGVLGILSFFFREKFWLAVIISRTIFSLGTAYTHYLDLRINKNKNCYNIGPVFWFSGIFIPLLLVTLGILDVI